MGGFQNTELLDKSKSNLEYYKRLVQVYQNNMLVIGLNASLTAQRLDSGLMELPLYYIGLFSKHPVLKTIQRDILEHSQQQISLFQS
jgi:hypothetical protein